MATTRTKTVNSLVNLIAVLAFLAAAGGVFAPSLYRDNAFVKSGWLGNDLVTLIVAVPALLVSASIAKRGSLRARLVMLGMLDYMLYNYGFYLFGTAFNVMFLVYVLLFGLSIYALMFGLMDLEPKQIVRRFKPTTPVRWISGFMVVVAIFLGGYHTAIALSYLDSGVVPEIVDKVGHPTNVIAALDLVFVVSVNLLGAVWLWNHQPWGYIIAAVINVKGAAYMLALSAATVTAYLAGQAQDLTQVGLWGAIGAGCLAASLVLFNNLQRVRK